MEELFNINNNNNNNNNEMYVCYFLRSLKPNCQNRTYIGSTNNIKRRLRQHNGIIKGGAKATQNFRPYEIFCIVAGFDDKINALRHEWMFKHPNGRRQCANLYYGLQGRLRGINDLLYSDYYKKKNLKKPTKIYIKSALIVQLDIAKVGDEVEIIPCDL